MFADVYRGRRVLVTGHTGFKGSWLATWLLDLGAEVAGYALDLPSEPCNFDALGLSNRLLHVTGDIRDRRQLSGIFESFQPEIVFHLAAQSLVRRSYDEPCYTIETNVLGTLNLLECIRAQQSVEAAVIITSDKCYRNAEWLWGYRENDELGGDDPYSASKACAELVSRAYMASYFSGAAPRIATTRAGNVIGGGDWAKDRIVPDAMCAWAKGNCLDIRKPAATRPWQHVLEPLSGYLWLAARLYNNADGIANEAFNFGPGPEVNQSVADLLGALATHWSDAKWRNVGDPDDHRPESTLLKLNCDKAWEKLRWRALLSFADAVRMTSEWYLFYYREISPQMFEFASRQIEAYVEFAEREGVSWIV